MVAASATVMESLMAIAEQSLLRTRRPVLSGTAAPDVAISAAGATEGSHIQEFLRERRPVRPA